MVPHGARVNGNGYERSDNKQTIWKTKRKWMNRKRPMNSKNKDNTTVDVTSHFDTPVVSIESVQLFCESEDTHVGTHSNPHSAANILHPWPLTTFQASLF